MRCFVGLEVSDIVGVPLAETLAPWPPALPEARWAPRVSWHLTLVFLGELVAARLGELDVELESVCTGQAAFELEFEGCGTFPPNSRARVAWVGVRDSPALSRLQAAVARACSSLDLEVDRRRYFPHLTVARSRRPWPQEAVDLWKTFGSELDMPSLAVTRCCLFESLSSGRGVHYEVIRSYSLAGAVRR